jgi:hypothetical protein
MTVQDLLNQLGGTAKVSRALNLPLTTVAGWGQTNSIPKWRLPRLAELAISQGVAMPADFGPARPRQKKVAA